MALQAKAIKEKIGSVKNIRKITKAMELVSVSKMKKAVDQTLATRYYATRALEILVALSHEGTLRHPLLGYGNSEKVLLVVISSNKGLCGSYNVNINKKVLSSIEKQGGGDNHAFVAIGKNSEKLARKSGGELVASFIDVKENPRMEDILGITRLILDEYKKGRYKKVMIAYSHYISALSNKPVIRQILPVMEEDIDRMIDELDEIDGSVTEVQEGPTANYLYEPSEEELLEALLPRLTEVRVYQAILEGYASEHSSRMFAMKNATENADRLADDLKLSYNRARQEGITNEIAEIASGAEALNG